MSILEGLTKEVVPAQMVAGKSTEDGLQTLEDALLQESAGVVSAAARFNEITPSDTAPPDEWIEQLGEKQAWAAFRVAQQAWLPKRDAAMGIELCVKLVTGIISSRARRKESASVLQVNLVEMAAPQFEYKRLKDANNE